MIRDYFMIARVSTNDHQPLAMQSRAMLSLRANPRAACARISESARDRPDEAKRTRHLITIL